MSLDPFVEPPKQAARKLAANIKGGGPGERVWFLGTLLTGVLFLILTATAADQLLLIALGAGGVMTPYCIYAVRQAERTGEHDRVADSCYYLGFLLTLIGLTISLYVLGQGGDNQAGGVVARFGAAITTTLVGMIFRIMIVQFRPDPANAPQQAEAKIAESMLHVAQELEVAVKQFEDIRRNTVNNINQATKAAEKRINTAVETQIKVTEKFSIDAFERHAQILENLEQTLGNISIDTGPFTESLNDVMGAIEKQMSRLQGVLSNIGDAGEATERRWSGLQGRLDIIADSLEGMSKSAQQFATTGDSLAKTGSELDKVTGALGNSSKAVENLGKALSGSEAVVQRMKTDIEANLSDIQALRLMIKDEHGAAAQATDELYKKLASMLDLINSRLAAAESFGGHAGG